jgi:hypothetical protein
LLELYLLLYPYFLFFFNFAGKIWLANFNLQNILWGFLWLLFWFTFLSIMHLFLFLWSLLGLAINFHGKEIEDFIGAIVLFESLFPQLMTMLWLLVEIYSLFYPYRLIRYFKNPLNYLNLLVIRPILICRWFH